jgi:hypothetical protein
MQDHTALLAVVERALHMPARRATKRQGEED